MHPTFPFNNQYPTAPPATEDEELATAINASLHSAPHERPVHTDSDTGSQATTSSSSGHSASNSIHEESCFNVGSTSQEASQSKLQSHTSVPSVVQIENPSPVPVPSAPVADAFIDDGPIHYPSIDMTELSSPSVEAVSATSVGVKLEDIASSSSSCTICLDAPLEGACIPCGHMAGCMSCLNEIKGKKFGCPVCRANIDQIIRIYAV